MQAGKIKFGPMPGGGKRDHEMLDKKEINIS